MQEHRPLNAFVDLDALEELDSVKAEPLYDAMVDSNIDVSKRTEVINRLLNAKIDASATVHPAKILARSNLYLRGSRVTFRHRQHAGGVVSGILGQAYEASNGDVAVEVSGAFRVISGNTRVKVWPPKPA